MEAAGGGFCWALVVGLRRLKGRGREAGGIEKRGMVRVGMGGIRVAAWRLVDKRCHKDIAPGWNGEAKEGGR